MRTESTAAATASGAAPTSRRVPEQLLDADGRAWASRDALWRGRLPLWQPARGRGYRFTLDAVLLAGFAPVHPSGDALDLGAGCGIVGLLLLACGKAARLTAVERQPAAAELARRNVAAYGWQARAGVVEGDLRATSLPAADLVVFNPPYFPAAASRPAQDPGRDAGRRECFGTLADFVARGAHSLRPGGSLACIVPYARRTELLALVEAAGLEATRLRPVRPRAEAPPLHLLLSARRAGGCPTGPACPAGEGPLGALPALVVHAPAGGYTPEVQALIDGPAAAPGPPRGGAGPSPSAG